MSAEILKLVTNGIGSGVHIEPDRILENAKGRLSEVVVIGAENGEIVCFSSEGVERALWLVERAKRDLLLGSQ